jgi:hypothetical protein
VHHPAVIQAGWDEATQIRREMGFTKGRIIVHGKLVMRGKAKRADHVLYYQHIAMAILEAKDNNHAVGDGMRQALDDATILDVPFVFSSNGDGFVFHDRTGMSTRLETTLSLDLLPSPPTLWPQYRAWKGLLPEQEKLILQPYYDDPVIVQGVTRSADPDRDTLHQARAFCRVLCYHHGSARPCRGPVHKPREEAVADALPLPEGLALDPVAWEQTPLVVPHLVVPLLALSQRAWPTLKPACRRVPTMPIVRPPAILRMRHGPRAVAPHGGHRGQALGLRRWAARGSGHQPRRSPPGDRAARDPDARAAVCMV